MTSNGLKHQARMQEWSISVQECRSSGLPVKEWCRNRGIHPTTYYRWERCLLEKATEERKLLPSVSSVTFAELPEPQENRNVAERAATVRINGIEMDIYANMDATLIKALMEAARSC